MIRSFKKSDLPTLSKIYQLARPYEFGKDFENYSFQELTEEKENLKYFLLSTIVVLEEEGKIKGFGGYVQDYIAWLYVHPAFHRQKVGTLLLNYMLKKLQNKKQLKISIVKNNIAAKQCYEALGFREKETFIFNFQGQELEGLRMVRGI